MPLRLVTPIVETKTGDTFEVISVYLNFRDKHMQASWRVIGEGGTVREGVCALADDTIEGITEFTDWYNDVYTTHNSLVETVATAAGFTGECIDGVYV